jgi:23S rRNA (uracil1939-C5)-methyltransferase
MKLRIEKSVYGGSGLARIGEGELAGKAAFVPLTLPGELVEANIVEGKRSFINAQVASILEPSSHRELPACPYFGACGGCSYQHADYNYQLQLKTAILREALYRAHISNLPEIDAVGAKPWQYRNRVRFHLRSTPFALAYRERRSNKLLVVDKCPIAAPIIEKATATVTEAGASLGLSAFWNEIEFFAADEDSLLLSFLASRRDGNLPSKLREICQALKEILPELKGSGVFLVQDKQPPRLLQTWGDESLNYRAAGREYRVSAGSFFQVNRFLVDPLVELAAKHRSGRLAWDLYAGVGLFARALADRFERVIAVESSPASSADLRHNLQGTSSRVIEASTLEFLRKQKSASAPPDLVIVDPPRAGLGPEVTSLLAQIGPAEIVYVSCDPATLARDLDALLQSGYDLRTITMVDMFPQTFHLESVSVLTRR